MNEHSCQIIVFSSTSFDVLGLRRAINNSNIHCDAHFLDNLDDLKKRILAHQSKINCVIIDYEKVEDAPKGAAFLLEETMIPVVGIFSPKDASLVINELKEGLLGYAYKGEDNSYLEMLVVYISSLMGNKDEFSQVERFKEQVLTYKRERHALLNASLTLITYHLPDTKIVWSNAFEEEGEVNTFDYLAGRYCREIWKFGGIPNGKCPVATAIEIRDSVEAEVITMDGYTMLQRAYPAKDDNGKVVGVIASTLDMSAVSPAQEAVRTAARIQASATLAGGIAHKFNNLMAGVMGNVSLAQVELGHEHPASEMLMEIEQAAVLAGELSEQLLAFARGGKYLPKKINLNDVIKESLQASNRTISPKISIESSYEDSLWPIEANWAQMGLLFTQVFNNAVEAIEAAQYSEKEKGKVRISTSNEEIIDSVNSDTPWLKDGRYILLNITDNGIGMSPETRKKIFEPFFTTKKKGRGLGLAGAYGIVRTHDGHIFVKTEKEKGTSIQIHLPASNIEELKVEVVPTLSLVKEPSLKVDLYSGNETILLIDDETMLRRAIKRVLERLGYNVIEASTGDQAVKLAQNYKGSIDVALLDMIMPGIDGIDAYRQLKNICPSMEIIVMSGYDKETYGEALLDAGVCAFLQKPIPTNVIAKEIRSILNKKEK